MGLRSGSKPLLCDLRYSIIHNGEHSIDKDLYVEDLIEYCDYIERKMAFITIAMESLSDRISGILSEAEKDVQSYGWGK